MGTIKDKIILLVDDEPAILQMCQSILKENGFENIVTANTALSALERMSAKPDMAVWMLCYRIWTALCWQRQSENRTRSLFFF